MRSFKIPMPDEGFGNAQLRIGGNFVNAHNVQEQPIGCIFYFKGGYVGSNVVVTSFSYGGWGSAVSCNVKSYNFSISQ